MRRVTQPTTDPGEQAARRTHVQRVRGLVSGGGRAERVSTIELFFDLVFVFTITELTHLVVDHPSPAGLLQALLVLTVTWWMYGAYAWLTNSLPPRGVPHRILLVVGMIGFFTMALATPHAFGADGLAFGLGYLLVVVLHSGVFALSSDTSTVRAILRIAPTNVGSALCVVAAGFVDGPADWVLWPLAVVVAAAVPLLRGPGGFTVESGHFVERHGLIVIVVLGESVVALGAAAESGHLGPGTVVVCALGLLLAVGLWWVYFDVDESGAEAALEAAPADRRARLSLLSFGVSFVPLLLGVVLVAAGLEESLASPWRPAHWPAPALLAGGTALYLVGEACFRLVLGIRPVAGRLAAAGVAAATTGLGVLLPAAALIAVLAGVLVVLLVAESRARAGSPVLPSPSAERPEPTSA